ncbi:PREDICTED: LIM domain-binding protein 2-like, partial [Eurypyga helias]|uniref:LIM domain-binding protein 2-like n=1 Tax=Eurypyga helias TaxID=54383 RepID=UPI0005280363
IGRTLIPRYFSTVFEGGVTDLYYILKHSKESYHNSSITVDCDQCTMVTQHGKPMFTKVCTEGRLILEFTFDDLMRIKTWHFTIRQYRELVPRSILAMHAQDPQVLEQLSKNITRMGLTNFTLNYLRVPVTETSASPDKTSDHGKIEFSKLAAFGGLWDPLAARHCLTSVKETGWWSRRSEHLSGARLESRWLQVKTPKAPRAEREHE